MPTLLKIARVFMYLGFAAALAGIAFSIVIEEYYFIISFVILAVLGLWAVLGIPKRSKIARVIGIISGIINLCPVVYNLNTGETIIAPINPVVGIIILVALISKAGREWFSPYAQSIENE